MDRLTSENAKKALELIKQFVNNTPQDAGNEDLKTKKKNADRAIDYFDSLIALESSTESSEKSGLNDICNDCLSFLTTSAVEA